MRLLGDGFEISGTEFLCLENDLLNPDEWIRAAIRGKIESCKKRLLREWTPKLLSDSEVQQIPADEDALITFIVGQPDYLNRVEREAELSRAGVSVNYSSRVSPSD